MTMQRQRKLTTDRCWFQWEEIGSPSHKKTRKKYFLLKGKKERKNYQWVMQWKDEFTRKPIKKANKSLFQQQQPVLSYKNQLSYSSSLTNLLISSSLIEKKNFKSLKCSFIRNLKMICWGASWKNSLLYVKAIFKLLFVSRKKKHSQIPLNELMSNEDSSFVFLVVVCANWWKFEFNVNLFSGMFRRHRALSFMHALFV